MIPSKLVPFILRRSLLASCSRTHPAFLHQKRYLSQESNEEAKRPNKRPQSKAQLDWRKRQLDNLEKQFTNSAHAVNKIQDEEDLQPMWKEMESRVSNRRSRTLEQNKGKIGRANVRKTDEDIWLQEGLYDTNDEKEKK